MHPADFAAKWGDSTRTERAASQEHFIDLCRMLGVPTPNEADPTGEWYAFEKGIEKAGGGDGYADVWKKRHFAWEYKGKRKDLTAAYAQLQTYRDALENPPILVVCDLNRFEVRTNFTNTPTRLYAFTLEDMRKDPAEPLRVLRALMTDPEELRPREAADELTKEAAGRFAQLALSLRARGEDPERVAHFLDKLLFCLYAEDAQVLPKGLLSRLAETTKSEPAAFAAQLGSLFERMATTGGYFGVDKIEWFNGGLFADADVLELTKDEIAALLNAGRLDWSLIEPAIFGTLFERGLDPGKRTQLGAHYTDRASIERLVEPVVMAPLRREFDAMRAKAADLLATGKPSARAKALDAHHAFLDRLRKVRCLDSACGSGNFLYVVLRKLKDVEFEAISWGSETFRIPMEFPQVGPEAVMGIEINPYAADLARLSIWIGEIQWHLNHGFAYRRDPVLRTLDNVRTGDALLDLSDPAHPREAEWPAATYIVGNPPFLGGKRLRSYLGDAYVDALFEVFRGRVPQEADYVAYWLERARAAVHVGQTTRVGLLATQGIRGGANRKVIERIKETGDLFLAWSDEEWVLDGAAVHISFLGYDDGTEQKRFLDGSPVLRINPNLTAGIDVTVAKPLAENRGIAFMGTSKGGPFDITAEQAHRFLAAPNPDGRPNSDVVKPWANGLITKGGGDKGWIIDFGADMKEPEAALYEGPYEYARWIIKPTREGNNRAAYAERWWIHVEPRQGMRRALTGLTRYIATVRHSKHRLFFWLDASVLPDSALIVFARDDDYTFGILHSRVHEIWARATGTQVREVESGFRYTPSSTFETFSFPDPSLAQRAEISDAARRLVMLRNGWLNPVGVDEAEMARRSTTALYNERPTWLRMAHETLDAAVLGAYGLPGEVGDDQVLAHLLDLNLRRSAGTGLALAAAD